MSASQHPKARTSSLYSQQDYDAILKQIRRRKHLIALPCYLLLIVLFFSLAVRMQWITIACTILMGVIFIAGSDLLIRPLNSYRDMLHNALYGRVHEVKLPFAALSAKVNLVDGVPCRALTCTDVDAKGRPYERLFYLDAQKAMPDVEEGDMLHIVHHGLNVADITLA